MDGLLGDPIFRTLAEALWQTTGLRGAALMVGAGFSRNADRSAPAVAPAPLWGDLAAAMARDLGVDPTAPPLELAQSHVEMFGRSRLEELVREMIDDSDLAPGPLHERLLRLGWSDVLTTNYDTLLERTAEGLYERVYEVVLTPRDIARTRTPRIVKLHGSLPSVTPFVITRDDYASYTRDRAPFVNLARQVLLENDVCMVGFSGDDPNFAAWTTWVFDEIAEHARSLFLVGVLDVDQDARAALRRRRITPIDLAPYAGAPTHDRDGRARAAMDVFLAALERSRPAAAGDWGRTTAFPAARVFPSGGGGDGRDWIDVHDPDFAMRFVMDAAPLWRRDREAYPGWLEPPPDVRTRIASSLHEHLAAVRNGLSAIPLAERPRVLADVLFRADLVHASLERFETDWIADTLATIDAATLRDVDRELLGALMLREAREGANGPCFERWIAWIQDTGDRACRAQASYAQALRARDDLDWSSLSELIPEVRGDDPVWALRRSALMAEIGDGVSARREIAGVHRELKRRCARNRRSVWLRSRLAWASMLRHVVEAWGTGTRDNGGHEALDGAWHDAFKGGDCDPWAILERLDDAVATARSRQAADRASPRARFEPGAVARRGFSMRSAPTVSIDRLAQRLADRIGLPGSVPGVYANVMASRIADAVEIAASSDLDGIVRCIVAATRVDRSILENRFNRIDVALLDRDVAAGAAHRLSRALEQALERVARSRGLPDVHLADAVRIWLELLSRLAVRLDAARAAEVFDLAMRVALEAPRMGPAASEALGDLVTRAFGSLDDDGSRRALARLHEFPLPGDGPDARDSQGWPEPFCEIGSEVLSAKGTHLSDLGFEILVRAFGGAVRADVAASARRLEVLARAELLTPSQRSALDVLTRAERGRSRPGLPHHVAFQLLIQSRPMDVSSLHSALRAYLMGTSGLGLERCEMIRWAGVAAPDLARASLDVSDLLTLFDQLAAWRPPERTDDPLRNYAIRLACGDDVARSIASGLNRTVLGLLSPGSLIGSAAERLASFATSPPSPYHLVLGPQIVRHRRALADAVMTTLRRSLASNDRREVAWSILAVRDWLSLVRDLGLDLDLPDVLTDAVVGLACSRPSRAMPAALAAVPDLIAAGRLRGDDASRLVDAMGAAWTQCDYADANGSGELAASFSLIRAEAMRICGSLRVHGLGDETTTHLLAVGMFDPLPEVRAAARAGSGIPARPAA